MNSVKDQFLATFPGYKVNSKGVYFEMIVMKKTRKVYLTESQMAEDLANNLLRAAVNKNLFEVKNYLESNGAKKLYVAKSGCSIYYNYKGLSIRVSDHENISDLHPSPSINAFSNEVDGYKLIISQLEAV